MALTPAVRIMTIGDSICKYRVAETEEDWPRAKTWPRLLKAAFVSAGYQAGLLDIGVAGQNSGYFAITNLAAITQAQLAAYEPHIVVIELGTNDCQGASGAATLEANLGTLITQIKAYGCSRIIVANVIHKFQDATYITNAPDYNTAANAAAVAGGAYLADYYTAYDAHKGSAVDDTDQATYAADGIHPGELGHSLLHALNWAIVQAQGWHTAHYGRR